MKDNPIVFLSSTIKDFIEDRAVVKKFIKEQMKFDIFASEYEGADCISPSDKCFEALKNADLMILLIGSSYGHKPKWSNFPFKGEISVTHAEYKMAIEYGKPILIYIKNVAVREEEEMNFMESVRDFNKGRFTENYDTPDQLWNVLGNSFPNLIARLIRGTYNYPQQFEPKIIQFESPKLVYQFAAECIKQVLRFYSIPSLLLCGGSTSTSIYEEFFNDYIKGLLKNAILFTNFEYLGFSPNNEFSRRQLFYDIFISKAIIHEGDTSIEKNVNYVPGVINTGTINHVCKTFDSKIAGHPPHLGIQSISTAGEFAGICPEMNSGNDLRDIKSSILKMSETTTKHLVLNPNAHSIVTVGLGNILKKVSNLIIPLIGKRKSEIVREMLYGSLDNNKPLKHLREHNNLILVIDEEASNNITMQDYKDVEFLSNKINLREILSL